MTAAAAAAAAGRDGDGGVTRESWSLSSTKET